MALSWTMDKLGPITRSAEDCALVLDAIYGPDGKDASVHPAVFNWDPSLDWKKLRIGYLKSEFDPPEPLKPQEAKPNETAEEKSKREAANATPKPGMPAPRLRPPLPLAALDKLRAMGVNLIPVELPKLPYGAMAALLTAEAAASFDDLTMTGRDALLTEQGIEDWPNAFRIRPLLPGGRVHPGQPRPHPGRPASLRAFRPGRHHRHPQHRHAAHSHQPHRPSRAHPPQRLPRPRRSQAPAIDDGDHDDIGGPGTPVSLTFLAAHYQDAKLAAFASAYQQATRLPQTPPHPRLIRIWVPHVRRALRR
jgi:hypothetical protein